MSVRELQKALKQLELQNSEKTQIKQEIMAHPVDAIKNDILRLAKERDLILVPVDPVNNKNTNVQTLVLKPNITPPIPNNNAIPADDNVSNIASLPTLKISFVAKTRDALTDEEAKLLETNNSWLESSFETFKKELGGQGITTNSFTAVMRTGTFPINIPNAIYHTTGYINWMFVDKLLETNPGSAPQAAAEHSKCNERNNLSTLQANLITPASAVTKNIPKENVVSHESKELPTETKDSDKSHHHTPFSTKPRPPGIPH
jgi:tetrahydromethanopterin S-methyltransferase subunit B